MELADKKLKTWFKAFPNVKLCIGNHDPLVARKAITHGLPDRVFKPFRDIWNLPSGWEYKWSYNIDGVRYEHGLAFGGKFPNANACYANRQSTVIGHLHSVAGVYWTASDRDIIFGLSVGCGIDRRKYAFHYGNDYKRKPIIGAGVVLNKGKDALFVPMEI